MFVQKNNPAIFEITGEPRIMRPPAVTEGTANCSAKDIITCSSPEARECLPYPQAEKLKVLPLSLLSVLGREVLTVACDTGASPDLASTLRFVTGKDIRLVPLAPDLINAALFRAYRRDERPLVRSIEQLRLAEPCNVDPSPILEPLSEARGEAVQFVNALVEFAIAKGASDLHLVPCGEGTLLKLRINGDLLTHQDIICGLTQHERIINRLKVLAKLDTSSRSLPQDGEFSVPIPAGSRTHLRLNIMPTVQGEKAVIRLGNSFELLGLNDLGLPAEVHRMLARFMLKEEGMALFAGATGSGKTTTMYAALTHLLRRNLSLVTLEDPVEKHLAGAAQTSINVKQGLDYSTALKAVVRQDPDVIMLGEIRDGESAKAAFQAALTGHLVLSAVHARDSLEVLLRLEKLGVDLLLISQALALVVCQKLLPKLCPDCRVFDLAASQQLGFDVHKAAGCCKCEGGGYSGRALAVEMLAIGSEEAHIILEAPSRAHAFAELRKSGNYYPFSRSVEQLLREGNISAERSP